MARKLDLRIRAALPLIIKPKMKHMKNILLVGAILLMLASCDNGKNDTSTNPSDTTGTQINPALEDPNSNMADTMHMVDSSRVKDTTIRDSTSGRPKR